MILHGGGDGTFSSQGTFATGLTAGRPLGDLNGDGWVDLVGTVSTFTVPGHTSFLLVMLNQIPFGP